MKKPAKTDMAISVDTEGPQRKPVGLVEVWCSECSELVNTVTIEAAAVLSDVDTRTIDQRIMAGMIHRLKTADGLLLICLNSLLK